MESKDLWQPIHSVSWTDGHSCRYLEYAAAKDIDGVQYKFRVSIGSHPEPSNKTKNFANVCTWQNGKWCHLHSIPPVLMHTKVSPDDGELTQDFEEFTMDRNILVIFTTDFLSFN